MRASQFVSGFVAAIAIAFTAGTVTAFAQSEAPKDVKPAKASTLAALKSAAAVPMEQAELRTVKGLHIHFTTPSANEGHPLVEPTTGWHFVNHTENNLGKGQALPIAGPGYSGLCGAALLSGALTIPGQTSGGTGGGC
ncbi:MAG TPA: hypothetical protein VFO19_21950 [Vicinamibacterales bacterium]|nr:hypothetical protein [Vicinamibacterales bacterium]